jgi:hypothetical protein
MLGFTETGQVGVNDGDDRALVAEVDLDLAEVFATFKQVGGIGMTQMPSSAFASKCGVPGNAELDQQNWPNTKKFSGF